MKKISNKLKRKLNSLPDLPGVYNMLDKEGRTIYIGKSISLSKRVKSYFREKPERRKVEKMYPLIEDINFKVMDTDLEARLEECRLIKEIKPIFNSQFLKDKNFLYLKIKEFNPYSPISLVYTREENCYGPFKSTSLLRNTVLSLQNLYPIINVKDMYKFKYNLIPISMNKEEFLENKSSLNEIFSRDENFISFLEELEKNMERASEKLRFETAMYYRDLIRGMKYINYSLLREEEIFSKDILLRIKLKEGYKLFFIKNGKIILKEKVKRINEEIEDEFIQRGKKLNTIYLFEDEKVNLDFRDILLSEINKNYYKIC